MAGRTARPRHERCIRLLRLGAFRIRTMTLTEERKMVPILFRYFMAASLMRQEFDEHLRDPNAEAEIHDNPDGLLCQ